MPTIDLNCDMGESFGAWRMGDDAGVMPWVTSVNIACGFHAGDALHMQATVRAAAAHGVAIGAHVGLSDLQGFGRREMKITHAEAYAITLYQLGALHAVARAQGAMLRHVKPHGALYNMAARDTQLADAIAAAVRDFDARLMLVGLAGSALPAAGVALGLRVAHEAFVDRRYEKDGSLSARSEPGAVIDDMDVAVVQALQIVLHARATARDGSAVAVCAETICVHGDRMNAAHYAACLHRALTGAGVTLRAIGAAS